MENEKIEGTMTPEQEKEHAELLAFWDDIEAVQATHGRRLCATLQRVPAQQDGVVAYAPLVSSRKMAPVEESSDKTESE